MYQRILVPLDGSPPSERGLREAVWLAAEHDGRLLLLHVIEALPLGGVPLSADSLRSLRAGQRRHGEDLLDRAKRLAAESGVNADAVLFEPTSGRVADAIVEQAGTQGCDLIAMGTHGRRGAERVLLGSDAERVLRISPVPVLLVRHPEADGGDK